MSKQVRKSKQVTVRLSLEDWKAVRNAAYSKGKDIGPMLADWIRPRILRLRTKAIPKTAE
jgi:hypothetical protein